MEGAGLEPELTLAGRLLLRQPSRLGMSPSATSSTVEAGACSDALAFEVGTQLALMCVYRHLLGLGGYWSSDFAT